MLERNFPRFQPGGKLSGGFQQSRPWRSLVRLGQESIHVDVKRVDRGGVGHWIIRIPDVSVAR